LTIENKICFAMKRVVVVSYFATSGGSPNSPSIIESGYRDNGGELVVISKSTKICKSEEEEIEFVLEHVKQLECSTILYIEGTLGNAGSFTLGLRTHGCKQITQCLSIIASTREQQQMLEVLTKQ
jgi:hypothetical protein